MHLLAAFRLLVLLRLGGLLLLLRLLLGLLLSAFLRITNLSWVRLGADDLNLLDRFVVRQNHGPCLPLFLLVLRLGCVNGLRRLVWLGFHDWFPFTKRCQQARQLNRRSLLAL